MEPVPIDIRPLEDADLDTAARVLATLNPTTPVATLRERLATMRRDHPNYRCVGAFADGRLAGVCGSWIVTRVWCGRCLEIDNLVVDPALRNRGIGGLLIDHLETLAREAGCTVLTLDSYIANEASHRLYRRHGFENWSYHFVKPVGDWSGAGTA